ncbi:hypothetical protein BDN71DRAFT_1510410 [Pleurotus eryngii]|uniref:Uncharacterized protein n=1 Tax=Pleurotus eryngii TaxID=5323 RepID=A0A9P5ZS75_PLEER|nr:hypothetical protein BDN71DRAFT_1510410 [Pleurotus eryngii]
MARTLEQILAKTRFCGIMVLVGPEPKEGGNLKVLIADHGKMEAGSDIFDFTPGLHNGIKKALSTPAIRACHSLPGMEAWKNYSFNPESTPATIDPAGTQRHRERVAALLKETMRKVDASQMDVDEEDTHMAGVNKGNSKKDDSITEGEEEPDAHPVNTNPDNANPAVSDNPMTTGGTNNVPTENTKKGSKKSAVEPWPEMGGEYLQGFKGHTLWPDLVDTFLAHKSYVSSPATKARLSLLAAMKRPVVLSEWIRAGRRAEKHQKLSNDEVETLTQELYDWWFSLQPESCIPNGSCHDCSDLSRSTTAFSNDAWVEVNKGTGSDGSPSDAFDSLIDDVLWVLRHLVTIEWPAVVEESPSAGKPRSTLSTKPRSSRHH